MKTLLIALVLVASAVDSRVDRVATAIAEPECPHLFEMLTPQL